MPDLMDTSKVEEVRSIEGRNGWAAGTSTVLNQSKSAGQGLTPGSDQHNDEFLLRTQHPKAVYRRLGNWRASRHTPGAATDLGGRRDGFGRGSLRPPCPPKGSKQR
jgi:hypothetical protein